MEEKKVIKLRLNTIIIIIFFTILILGGIFWKININTNDTSIEFFAMQTHNGLRNSKYKITNQQELDMICTDEFKLSNEYDLSNNTIFIQTQKYGSGSITIDFQSVNIDKSVEFKFTYNKPKIGTTDMVCWYLVAIIPNTKLDGVNIDEWKSPLE